MSNCENAGVHIYFDSEVDLSMSPDRLAEFAQALRLPAGFSWQVSSDRGPATLEVALADGKLLLSVDAANVFIRGSAEALALLFENLEVLLSQWLEGGTQHMHFDPETNNFLLSPDSLPFIVSFNRI
jgi:hypothetical protein